MNLVFTDKPPKLWGELCSQQGDLFNTPQWHAVLSKGFGSDALYGWNEASSTGVSITVFKAGPFRIGYLGFPVGGTVGNGTIRPDMILDLKDAHFPRVLHCLRIPVSAFASNIDLPLPFQMVPETTIENLQEWRPESDSKLYRDIKKARHSLLRVADATDPLQGGTIFSLYRDTVGRQRGNMRYTLNYFSELIKLAKINSRLRCLLAVKDDTVAGFLVVACHRRSAYYLHAGTQESFKQLCPSDLLLYEAITWAKEQGMERFNMMASPPNQVSLIRYKEKWGGITREQKTYELVLRSLETATFKASAYVYERMSRIAELAV